MTGEMRIISTVNGTRVGRARTLASQLWSAASCLSPNIVCVKGSSVVMSERWRRVSMTKNAASP